MELSNSNIKKFLIFSCISRNGNQKNFFTIQETETLKSFLYFSKKKVSLEKKNAYILGN